MDFFGSRFLLGVNLSLLVKSIRRIPIVADAELPRIRGVECGIRVSQLCLIAKILLSKKSFRTAGLIILFLDWVLLI